MTFAGWRRKIHLKPELFLCLKTSKILLSQFSAASGLANDKCRLGLGEWETTYKYVMPVHGFYDRALYRPLTRTAIHAASNSVLDKNIPTHAMYFPSSFRVLRLVCLAGACSSISIAATLAFFALALAFLFFDDELPEVPAFARLSSPDIIGSI